MSKSANANVLFYATCPVCEKTQPLNVGLVALSLGAGGLYWNMAKSNIEDCSHFVKYAGPDKPCSIDFETGEVRWLDKENNELYVRQFKPTQEAERAAKMQGLI